MQSVHVRNYADRLRIEGASAYHFFLGDMRSGDDPLMIFNGISSGIQEISTVYKSVVIPYKSIFRAAMDSKVIDKNPTIFLTAEGGGVPQQENRH